MLKFNANQRYVTTAITAAILREVASRGGVPMQEVMIVTVAPLWSNDVG